MDEVLDSPGDRTQVEVRTVNIRGRIVSHFVTNLIKLENRLLRRRTIFNNQRLRVLTCRQCDHKGQVQLITNKLR